MGLRHYKYTSDARVSIYISQTRNMYSVCGIAFFFEHSPLAMLDLLLVYFSHVSRSRMKFIHPKGLDQCEAYRKKYSVKRMPCFRYTTHCLLSFQSGLCQKTGQRYTDQAYIYTEQLKIKLRSSHSASLNAH